MQHGALLYLHPEKFATRRTELQSKKPSKELVLDSKQGVTVRDKPLELQCSRVRDDSGCAPEGSCFRSCGMLLEQISPILIQRLQEVPPPGYSKISLVQVVRADRAAFTHIAETLKSLKRNPDGSKPLDEKVTSNSRPGPIPRILNSEPPSAAVVSELNPLNPKPYTLHSPKLTWKPI